MTQNESTYATERRQNWKGKAKLVGSQLMPSRIPDAGYVGAGFSVYPVEF